MSQTSMTGCIKVDKRHFDKLIWAFEREGFDPHVLQTRKPRQLWGGVKKVDYHNEWHIRILKASDEYEDFLLIESEIEVSREWLEHILYPSDPYYEPLLYILYSHNIPFQIMGNLPPTPNLVKRPLQYTEWKPLLLITLPICVGTALIWASTKVKENSVHHDN